VTANSLDAVADRDFVVEVQAAVALAMVHLSRLAEEITWWSNPRFGFVRLADADSTGSSMLPNKRNPDPAELVRGRAARVIGELGGLLALLKGLPLGYQRDLQEGVPALFDSCRALAASLDVMSGLVARLHVDEPRMREAAEQGYATAVSVADLLVDRGVPFRAAHHAVGALVRAAELRGWSLGDLADDDIRKALAASDDPIARALADSPEFPAAVHNAATLDAALARPDVIGGTAPNRVAAELAAAAQRLGLD
jgi:argininosuccinate lyase